MISVHLDGVDAVAKWLDSTVDINRTKMQNIGILMHRSIVENFNAGGRPVKWAGLAESTQKKRRNDPTSDKGMIPLSDKGGLRQSVGFTVTNNGVEIGPSAAYGIWHQLGFTVGKLFKTKVPAREFIVEPTEQEYTRIIDMIMGPSHV